MAPTTVLDQSTTTRTKINTVLLSNQLVFTRSDYSHDFGVYQLIIVGASEAAIYTLVPVLINALP